MVRVENVDAHHDRAQAYGAQILSPPTDHPYGERQYSATDIAGHCWTFTQAIADLAPEDCGGTCKTPRRWRVSRCGLRVRPTARLWVLVHGRDCGNLA